QLGLSDFFQLFASDLANLSLQRVRRTLVQLDCLLDQHGCRGRLDDKSEALVSKSCNHHRQRQTWLNTLSLRIECLAELHDVQTTLTQRRTDWRGWVGLTSWHLQLDEADDFLRHF